MGLEFGVWPPGALAAFEPVVAAFWQTYGTVDGPVRVRLNHEASALLSGADLEPDVLGAFVDAACREAGARREPGPRAGARFGSAPPKLSGVWPTGPYRRCPWNPLHLVHTETEAECVICVSAREGSDGVSELLAREVPGPFGEMPCGTDVASGRVMLQPQDLIGERLLKVHLDARAWFVDLRADGSCAESPLGDEVEWEGEWGCDSRGLLILSIGGYQLAVLGQADGIHRGLEFLSDEGLGLEPHSEPVVLEEFRVGVLDRKGQSRRAILSIPGSDAFRVTRVVGDTWSQVGPLDHAPLFESLVLVGYEPELLVRSSADEGLLELQSRGPSGSRTMHLSRVDGESLLWAGRLASPAPDGQVVLAAVVSFDPSSQIGVVASLSAIPWHGSP